MAKLSFSEIKPGVYIKADGGVFEIVDSVFSKKSRQQGSNKIKMKNLATGYVVQKNLHQSDSFEEADVTRENVIFIYERNGEAFFHKEDNPKDRLGINTEIINGYNLLKDGVKCIAVLVDEDIVTVKIPIKVELIVKEAPPAVKGNTAQGGSKRVMVETGEFVNTPLFINEGDVIRVNTETGEYVERVEKN